MRDGMGEGKNPQGDAPNPGGKGAGRERARHAIHTTVYLNVEKYLIY